MTSRLVLMIMIVLSWTIFDLHRWKHSVCKKFQLNANDSPDMWIRVSNFNIDQFSLVADDFNARVNLSIKVANLLSIHVNVGVSIDKVILSSAGKI